MTGSAHNALGIFAPLSGFGVFLAGRLFGERVDRGVLCLAAQVP